MEPNPTSTSSFYCSQLSRPLQNNAQDDDNLHKTTGPVSNNSGGQPAPNNYYNRSPSAYNNYNSPANSNFNNASALNSAYNNSQNSSGYPTGCASIEKGNVRLIPGGPREDTRYGNGVDNHTSPQSMDRPQNSGSCYRIPVHRYDESSSAQDKNDPLAFLYEKAQGGEYNKSFNNVNYMPYGEMGVPSARARESNVNITTPLPAPPTSFPPHRSTMRSAQPLEAPTTVTGIPHAEMNSSSRDNSSLPPHRSTLGSSRLASPAVTDTHPTLNGTSGSNIFTHPQTTSRHSSSNEIDTEIPPPLPKTLPPMLNTAEAQREDDTLQVMEKRNGVPCTFKSTNSSGNKIVEPETVRQRLRSPCPTLDTASSNHGGTDSKDSLRNYEIWRASVNQRKMSLPGYAEGSTNSLQRNFRSKPQLEQQQSLQNGGRQAVGTVDSTSIRQHLREGDEPPPPAGSMEYDETSIRYKGRTNPSKTFRFVQSVMGSDNEADIIASARSANGRPPCRRRQRSDQPANKNGEQSVHADDIVDITYVGGNIPSRMFRQLQEAVRERNPAETIMDSPAPEEAQTATPPRNVKHSTINTEEIRELWCNKILEQCDRCIRFSVNFSKDRRDATKAMQELQH